MIHSNGAYMEKKREAMATPQEFKDQSIKLDGKVLVCYVSVEDQDTFDIEIISNQAANEIEEGIKLIEGFPKRIEEMNKEIEKYNEDLAKAKKKSETDPKIKVEGIPKKKKELVLPSSEYKVDKILVYPWAHLSSYLSQEKSAADVCPMIANILKKRGYEAYYSPFGWYKAFKIECLGHEVAEMYRDIKLSVEADIVQPKSIFKIISENKEEILLCDSNPESIKKLKIPQKYISKEWNDFQDFINSEVKALRSEEMKEPPHIDLMQKFEIADFDEATDAGNLRWYTRGVIMKNLIRDYVENLVLENGAILVDTPVMYTVKNKKLTAQTARFPAKTYWVHSGNNRYLLRFASDFLLFNMFSQMQIREDWLPLRAYEYEQYAFRREQAGELSGLRRLRAFTMPDLHTLCKDLPQAIEEFKRQFIMVNKCLSDIGIKSFIIIRTTEQFWNENKEWIKDIIKEEGQPALLELWDDRYYYFILKYERAVVSAFGQTSTLSTIQIDVESSQDYIEQYGKIRQKYNIVYKDSQGNAGHPIILHNSPSGGVERVIWALLETNARNQDKIVTGFKTWLSPIQVRVIAVSEKHLKYAEQIMKQLNDANIRTDLDDRNEKITKKIRSAEVEWIPYVIVVGEEEEKNKTISVRKRLIGQPIINGNRTEQIQNINLSKFIEMLEQELQGFPRRKLPIPFRYYSKRINFR